MNIKKRFDFAKKWIYASDEDIKRIVWTDESPFCKHNASNERYCRRKVGEEINLNNLKPTFKFGGEKIMVWGCFGWNGVGEIRKISGIMDKFQYLDILKTSLNTSLKN